MATENSSNVRPIYLYVFFIGSTCHMLSCGMSVGCFTLRAVVFPVSILSPKPISVKPPRLKCFVNQDSRLGQEVLL